jgi:hypothetical protein
VSVSSFTTLLILTKRDTDLNVSQDTPLGILHGITLGPAKYTAKITFGGAKSKYNAKDIKDHAQCWFEQAPTDGLSAGKSLNAVYILQHVDSLVGKEVRLLSQTGACALRPLVDEGYVLEDVWEAWFALGNLSALFYEPEVSQDRAEEYLVSPSTPNHCSFSLCYIFMTYLQKNLDRALLHAYAACAKMQPTQMVAGVKWHLLAHLRNFVCRFGPALGFNEERYERYHSIVCDASLLSNRQAPSRDIGRRMELQETLKHIVSGGSFSGKDGTVLSASKPIQDFMKDSPLFQQLYGLQLSEKAAEPGEHFFNHI